MVFKAGMHAGWLTADGTLYTKATHVGFGFVLGEDGKRFQTRNTEVVRLVDLLDEAKGCSKTALIECSIVLDAYILLAKLLRIGLRRRSKRQMRQLVMVLLSMLT